MHARAAGIDLSKADAKVCVRVVPEGRVKPQTQLREFASTRQGIRELRDWLIECRVTCVLMESTSAYWWSFWDGLHDAGFEVLVVNATQVKQLMRGRKTDVKDARFLARVAAFGMLQGSFVPDRRLRDLRLLTRARVRVQQRRTQQISALEKLLEDTGSKLSEVSSKLLTVSGRAILNAICAGVTDPVELAKLSRLRRATGLQLVQALEADIRPVHITLIRIHLDLIDTLAGQVAQIEAEIRRACEPYAAEIEWLCGIPGVDFTLAAAIIAEIGVDMTVFPSPGQLAAWAGVAPGAHQSAKRTKTAPCIKGNTHLKACLSQAARSAVNLNGCFYQARFRKVRSRAGEAKAYTAIARSICTAIWHMLSRRQPYQELGADWYARTATTAQKARRIARLQAALTELGATPNPTHIAA
jgi:transposase